LNAFAADVPNRTRDASIDQSELFTGYVRPPNLRSLK